VKRLYLVGLSHKTAPIAVRERFALTGETLKEALTALRHHGVEEAMVLSTCNRVEVYLRAESEDPGRRFFLDIAPEAGGHLYSKLHEDAARHFFRVASSLDSMVLGEQQILGQVKEAYGLASAAESAGSFLSRLCNRAFATAKRVRTETEIGRGATSVSQVAVELVEKIFGDLQGRAVALVGAGKMGALSAKALASLGADRVFVANRSPERARALAEQVGGTPRPWEELTELLTEADVAIVSTGAPSYVITPELVKKVMKARRHRSMCFIDLAVPRNVDPLCGQQADVYAYDMDDLDKVVHASRSARAEAALRGEAIVEAELMAFAAEREARAALPVLHALRRQAEAIARAEAARTLARVGGKLDDKGRQSVEAMARAIVNKLLHLPTVHLKDAASNGDPALPGLAAQLFGIAPEAAAPEAEADRPPTAPRPAAADPAAHPLPENR